MNSFDARPELRSGILFCGLSLFIMFESLRLGLGTLKTPGPGFLPFCAGALLFAFSLVLVYMGWRMKASLKAHSQRVIIVLISLFAYSLLLDRLGFIIATFFLVAVLFRMGEYRQWWMLLGLSIAVTLASYLVFGVLLKVYLPRGFFGI